MTSRPSGSLVRWSWREFAQTIRHARRQCFRHNFDRYRLLPALVAGVAALALAAPAGAATMTIKGAELHPLDWSEIEGWAQDDHAAAFNAFFQSCQAVVKRVKPIRRAQPMDMALRSVCRAAIAGVPTTAEEARAFFEQHFRPVRISRLGEREGFLTGYYEPVVDGSRVPTGNFTVPVLRRPSDLKVIGKKRKGGHFPNAGKIGRQAGKGKTAPYFERAEIEDGALDGKKLEICYLKHPTDLFFAQIQGSVRVRLEDGAVLRLNYDAHNGHPYTPVGRILIDRGIIPKEEMSLERLRDWMLAHPDEAKELRRQNKSYVFFRVKKLADDAEAIGAQGIPLTAGRSIAVDKALHTYGTPFWIDAMLPLTGTAPTDRFRRLMVAQDTGSAIVGPARADIFFGAGDEMGRMAGRIRHPGTFVMLVPTAIAPKPVSAEIPLPRPRPKT